MVRLCTRLQTAGTLLAAAIIVAMAGVAMASDGPACTATAKPAPTRAVKAARALSTKPSRAATTPGSAGMRVAIDPETGLLIKPTAEQRQSIGVSASPELDRSSDGLVIVTLPDGTQLCDLKGRFQEYLVARKDAAGGLRTDCVQSPSAARRLLAQPAAARPGLVRQSEASRVKE